MAREQLQFSLITPEKMVFEGPADFVAFPAHDGEMGILLNRAPLVAQLGAGRLTVRAGQSEQTWFVDGGFTQVLENRVTVLTQKAVVPAEIDRAAAERDLEAARKMSTSDETSLKRRARVEASARARLHLQG